ncbi:AI-2E family transporter [Allocoleopsis franciscana]|uniref:Putative permease n=1 Tax=Allocoleopsis franciscana PCC 7113 TaxID=1173027 RepID=K9WD47_9CYAN|nr:AI-2E family transporter [Allocoleopsis franciscana]AFZ17726.1 putative permease [Allocoleopsis franciscana PCC 7113]
MSLGKLIGFLAFAVSLYILWEIRQVLLLVFAAIVFAVALNRVVRWLQQRGAKRGYAIALTVITLLLIFVILFALIGPSFATQLEQLINAIPRLLERLRDWLNSLSPFIPEQLLDVRNLGNFIPRVQPFVTQLLGNAYNWFSDLLSIILNLLLVIILTIMLLANPAPYRRGLILLFPAFYRRRADEILTECETTLVGWMTATLINMAAIGGVSFIGLLILRVPLALANALLAGLLEFIPNIGPVLSVIPPMAVALLDEPWKAIAVLILYLLIQQFEAYFLVPFVMKQQVSLLPAATLLSVIVFGSFFGFLGVFLSVPLVIVFKIWITELLIKDVLNNWHKDSEDESPPELQIISMETSQEPPITDQDTPNS